MSNSKSDKIEEKLLKSMELNVNSITLRTIAT